MSRIKIYDEELEKDVIFDTKTDCWICGEKHNIVDAEEGEVCESCFFDRRRMSNPAW
jgi:hypothetical protein